MISKWIIGSNAVIAIDGWRAGVVERRRWKRGGGKSKEGTSKIRCSPGNGQLYRGKQSNRMTNLEALDHVDGSAIMWGHGGTKRHVVTTREWMVLPIVHDIGYHEL